MFARKKYLRNLFAKLNAIEADNKRTNHELGCIIETLNLFMGVAHSIQHDLVYLISELQSTEELDDMGIYPVLKELQNIETKLLRIQRQPILSSIDLNILDHCNLNCKGCDHFAPLAEERFVAVSSIEGDLKQLSHITGTAVVKISILGGEPLLHPNLSQIFFVARSFFPKSLIQVISNGLLLLEQNQEFWNSCRENRIKIIVTKYPINLDYEKMISIAQNNQVDFSFFRKTNVKQKTLFKVPLDVEGLQNANLSFWNCHHVNFCPLLMEGKLYPCSIMPNVVHFNKKFGTKMEIAKEDFFDIFSSNNYSELLAFLNTPKPFCRFCKVVERTFGHPWELSSCTIEEWM